MSALRRRKPPVPAGKAGGALLAYDLQGMKPVILSLVFCCAALLAGCDSKPPAWETLLAAKIVEQYPSYSVSAAPGKLVVTRPQLDSKTIDVNEIAKFCQRGPKDCNYATEQMLIELRPPLASLPKQGD